MDCCGKIAIYGFYKKRKLKKKNKFNKQTKKKEEENQTFFLTGKQISSDIAAI